MFLNVEDSRNMSKRGEAEDTIKEEKNDLGKKKIGTTITSKWKGAPKKDANIDEE